MLEEAPREAVCSSVGLADLIQRRVFPDSWAPELGTSIEERGGRLLVIQTREVHELIGKFLARFRSDGSVCFRIAVDVYLGDRPLLEQALSMWSKPGFLAPGERLIVEGELGRGGVRRIGSSRTVCMNNQRHYALVGLLRSLVADVDVAGNAFDTTTVPLHDGLVVDVLPLASYDRTFVTLYVSATSTRVDAVRTQEVSVGCRAGVRSMDASIKVDKDGETSIPRGPDLEYLVGPARVQLPDLAVREFRTNVQMPLNTSACFLTDARKGESGRAMLFMIRARLLKSDGADPQQKGR
jgi:hypothetical protein